MCFLQEMQWKHAAAFNTGEFFQGAFEMVDDDTAVLLWLGEDAPVRWGSAARRSSTHYCKKAKYVDVADLTLPGVPAAMRKDLSPIVMGALANRLAQHYEAVRGHDLETAPLHVQGRLLIPDGPPLRTPRPTPVSRNGCAQGKPTRRRARREMRNPSCSTSTNSASCASSPVRCPSPVTSTRPSAGSSTQGATNLFFLGSGGAGILM